MSINGRLAWCTLSLLGSLLVLIISCNGAPGRAAIPIAALQGAITVPRLGAIASRNSHCTPTVFFIFSPIPCFCGRFGAYRQGSRRNPANRLEGDVRQGPAPPRREPALRPQPRRHEEARVPAPGSRHVREMWRSHGGTFRDRAARPALLLLRLQEQGLRLPRRREGTLEGRPRPDREDRPESPAPRHPRGHHEREPPCRGAGPTGEEGHPGPRGRRDQRPGRTAA